MGTSPLAFNSGIVCMLDALGIKGSDASRYGKFLDARNQIVSLMNEDLMNSPKHGQIEYWFASGSFAPTITHQVRIFAFQDTIVVAMSVWISVADKNVPAHQANAATLLVVAERLTYFMYAALQSGVLFRGAVSVGDFLHMPNDEHGPTIFGPAVDEAATWHDKTDWAGIILTPTAALHAAQAIEQFGLPGIREGYEALVPEYAVPLKSGIAWQSPELELRAVNWTRRYLQNVDVDNAHSKAPRNRKARAEFLSDLCQNHIAPCTEAKYGNTIAFFDKMVADYGDRI